MPKRKTTIRSLAEYSKALERNPEDPQIYFNRGTTYVFDDQAGYALADFDKAIELDPQNGAYYH